MKRIYLILGAVLILTASCKKGLVDKYESSQTLSDGTTLSVSKMTDVKVPAGFKWETAKDIQVKLSTNDQRFGNALHKVEVYSANPAEGGVQLAAGSISTDKQFEAKILTATTIKQYFVVKTAPDGSKVMEKLAINGETAQLNIVVAEGNSKKMMGKTAGPDCTTGCTTTVNNPSGNLSYSSGTTCLTGNVNINNLTLSNNAIVRICGTGTVNNFNFNGSSVSTLIITATGNITCDATIPVQTNVIVYGTLKTTGNNKHININSNSTFTNYGTVETSGNFNPNGQSVIVNNGNITVGRKLQNSSGADFTNNCKLLVIDNFDNNGLFKNYGYVKCNEETTIQGGSNNEFKQYNGAMLSTKDIQVNGTITGFGTSSLIKVTAQSKGNAQGVVNGAQVYCDANGIEGPWNASINGGATQSCSLYIATSSCNPEGNGNAPAPDTDGDGVTDANDCYPNDPAKAYCNTFGPSTVAFEDLWPYKGDYDLNDVVVNYTYTVVTNAANNVVRVEATYTLRATGGSFKNGFGVQFPVDRSKISGVTGATLEANQSKAVLVMFTDMRVAMANWNTVIGAAASPVVTYNVAFNVSNGPSLASFGLGSYNPFIYNGTSGFGRGYEIHLPGKLPTDLANPALFGTGHDGTNINAGTTYVSNDGGYPWAINIPGTFDYPEEKADINTAYLKFATWVSSGGNQFADWYTNGSGYRNNANIYQ